MCHDLISSKQPGRVSHKISEYSLKRVYNIRFFFITNEYYKASRILKQISNQINIIINDQYNEYSDIRYIGASVHTGKGITLCLVRMRFLKKWHDNWNIA